MTETKDVNANDKGAEQQTGKESQEPQQIPYARFKEKVDETNSYKERLGTLEKQLADIQTANKLKEESSLAEQGKFKDLYEQQKAENAKVLLEANNAKVYQDKVKALVEVEKTAIPESIRDLIPEGDPLFQLDYITKLKAKSELWGDKKPFSAGAKPGQGTAVSEDEVTTLKKKYADIAGKTDQNSQNARIAIRNLLAAKGVQI